MVEVRAATESNMKNRSEKKYPPAICWKIFGRVMNTSPSSAAGSIPKAKTAGKMAMPARMAMKVSAREIVGPAEGRVLKGCRALLGEDCLTELRLSNSIWNWAEEQREAYLGKLHAFFEGIAVPRIPFVIFRPGDMRVLYAIAYKAAVSAPVLEEKNF